MAHRPKLEVDNRGIQNRSKFLSEFVVSKMAEAKLSKTKFDSADDFLDTSACRKMHVPAFTGQPSIKVIDGEASIQELSDVSLDFSFCQHD